MRPALSAKALLRKLVAIPSITGYEAELAQYCQDFLRRHGFRCERQPLPDGRWNLLAVRGEANRHLLLYAHLDTVAPDPAWKRDPYKLRAEGDRLIGLGASDMKAGLAVILAAAAATSAPLKLALGVDEEAWSAGAWTLLDSGWCDDVAAVLVPELSIDSEVEHLGLGRRGHAGFEIEVRGGRRHGAVSGDEPAIERACRLVLALRAATRPDEALIVRRIEAGSAEFTVPEQCRLTLSYLTPPGRSGTDLKDDISALAAGFGASVTPLARPTPAPEAYAIPADHVLVEWVQAHAASRLEHQLEPAIGVSVADENVIASRGLPVLSLAPVGGASHRAGEWCSAASLVRTQALYTALIEAGLPAAT